MQVLLHVAFVCTACVRCPRVCLPTRAASRQCVPVFARSPSRLARCRGTPASTHARALWMVESCVLGRGGWGFEGRARSVIARAPWLGYRAIRGQPGASWPTRIRGRMCDFWYVFGLVLRIQTFVFDELSFLQSFKLLPFELCGSGSRLCSLKVEGPPFNILVHDDWVCSWQFRASNRRSRRQMSGAVARCGQATHISDS